MLNISTIIVNYPIKLHIHIVLKLIRISNILYLYIYIYLPGATSGFGISPPATSYNLAQTSAVSPTTAYIPKHADETLMAEIREHPGLNAHDVTKATVYLK